MTSDGESVRRVGGRRCVIDAAMSRYPIKWLRFCPFLKRRSAFSFHPIYLFTSQSVGETVIFIAALVMIGEGVRDQMLSRVRVGVGDVCFVLA